MRFAILGSAEVDDGAGPVRQLSGIPETVLVALLLSSPEPVGVQTLISAAWSDRPPRAAADSLRNHLTRLRRQVGTVAARRLLTHPPGYRMELDGAGLDAVEFQELSRRGRQLSDAGAWADASRTLASALALWRGDPLSGKSIGTDLATGLRRLAEDRLLAQTVRIDADLHLGRHRELVGELQDLTAFQPLHEPAWRQLMLALYRSGRQAEALGAFRRLRRTLIEELGIEPSPELQDLHQRILAQEPDVEPERSCVVARSGREVGPPVSASAQPAIAQLPADVGDFTGRDDEIRVLHAALAGGGYRAGRLPIVAVTGAGGMGKTALAVTAARRAAAAFPDGQLFADLRGMDAAPRDPADVLHDWLIDLGTPVDSVPLERDAKQARFRSLTHGKRILIVLDDARDSAQVSALLPAAPECAVLITSRWRLADLPDCTQVELDPLTAVEAVNLLAQIVGTRRLRAEPAATGEIVRACAGLPLALRIAGARLKARRSWPVHALAARLADQRRRLDELRIGGLTVRSSFEAGFRALPPGPDPESAPSRMFTLLGLATGPDIDADAAGVLAGIDSDQAEAALETLVDAHLLRTSRPGRYHLHGLLRDFARELAARCEPEARIAAVSRSVHWTGVMRIDVASVCD